MPRDFVLATRDLGQTTNSNVKFFLVSGTTL
jgi:hypothetical protein